MREIVPRPQRSAMLEAIFFRADGWDGLRVVIAAASLLSALVYLPFVSTQPSTLRTGIKTFTVGILALLPLSYMGQGWDWPLAGLALALALSALGDFFLALKEQRFFVPGLASFLAAHIAYVAVFLPHTSMPDGASLALIAAAIAAAGAFVATLAPKLGKLKLPIFAYFAVIMMMVAASLSIPEASWTLAAGALLFALSDSLIAVRKFRAPFPGIDLAVWATYCAAQYMIAASLIALLVPAQIG